MRTAPILAALALVGLASNGHAAEQTPPERDIELLHEMAGCFEVTYRFVEDGTHDSLRPDYELADPITEWIGFEQTGAREFMQIHASVTPDGRVVPHFHEIWSYRPEHGQWRHRVWSHVPGYHDRELRYACDGTWQRNRWACAAGRAGKPFRDSGAPFGFDRDDYDWLDRTNFVQVTPRGWVHNQHNRKMTEDDELVAYELGWIVYRRVEPGACGDAPEQYPKQPPETPR